MSEAIVIATFQLPSGLKAKILASNDPASVAMVKTALKNGVKHGWLVGNPDLYTDYCVVKVEFDKPFYLVYHQTALALKCFINRLEKEVEATKYFILFTRYKKKEYPFDHRITKLLLTTCRTGLSPEICALTADDGKNQ
jgi:hypothetical protein